MKEPKFTSGKWQVGKNAKEEKTCIWVGGSRIAIVDEFPHEGSEHNAKLIAASPELYKALKLATELLEDHAKHAYDSDVIEICKTALSLAVGE